ncbi:hypothetical protein [Nocardia seriolae]|uniref:Uncharacterized protein n=1 Tax=Nocardia seriolae TaxID=37332 RepID=A0A0B8N426_9NOCA|nr:hypothetical protein [Nocardia seriolae]APB00306.1 hypothetical protein NS506_06270 [Nocardia seriolae]MTJ64975.1 hypothetical protein [Nocardia seriolae]MTJ71829.1 hypothetical protein [Nocardia seriolae]MTJ89789.1 hypothetical protein [Nocardia seriolae]MTK33765.1 hypothetical protein [Nocardia seriolae]
MGITNQASRDTSIGSAPSLADLTDLQSAAVSFGYHQGNVAEGRAAVAHNKIERQGPIGWWNRHKLLTTGLSGAVAVYLALLPSVQSAALVVLGHVL